MNFSIQVLNKQRKFRLFTNWNGKPKQKINFSNSSFQQAEKVPTFNKLNRKTKTEREFSRFKILTNRIKQSTKRQHLIKFMLTFELAETDKHSIKMLLRRKNLRFLRRTNIIKTRWVQVRTMTDKRTKLINC